MDTVTNECGQCLWKANAIAWHENFNRIYAENQELKREIERKIEEIIHSKKEKVMTDNKEMLELEAMQKYLAEHKDEVLRWMKWHIERTEERQKYKDFLSTDNKEKMPERVWVEMDDSGLLAISRVKGRDSKRVEFIRADEMEKQVIAYRNDLAESNHLLQDWQKRYTEIKDKYNELVAKERREFYLHTDKYIYVKNLSYSSCFNSGYDFGRGEDPIWLGYDPVFKKPRVKTSKDLIDLNSEAVTAHDWQIRIPR